MAWRNNWENAFYRQYTRFLQPLLVIWWIFSTYYTMGCSTAAVSTAVVLLIAIIVIVAVLSRFESPPVQTACRARDTRSPAVRRAVRANRHQTDDVTAAIRFDYRATSSAGVEGDIGITRGPDVEGKLPSYLSATPGPINWLKTDADRYGPEGVTLRSGRLYSTFVPDHDPLTT